ncbi:RNA polymerase ECF-type sigma factor [Streptomyces laurentii]|uniref:RNA polymerase ECF-type sigma factor n=1 Tax=Streptomyces laurentii TaxID=39478 RepID=A0A170RZE9_STRLU|nr:RNA polymerase ECF-type sigma factor [Streptomyces laurentii]
MVDRDAGIHAGATAAATEATDSFIAHRNLLFTVAYEMPGSAADAEDVLKETWLRWSGPAASTRAGSANSRPDHERCHR